MEINPQEMIAKLGMEHQCPGNDKDEDAQKQPHNMPAKLEIEMQHPEKDIKTEHNQNTEKKLKERNLKFSHKLHRHSNIHLLG